MKITKFVHACILVETPDRAALFDPGVMSEQSVDAHSFDRLDDIYITHGHADHVSIELLKRLIAQFPAVHITAPAEVVSQLQLEGISASTTPPAGAVLFDSPHEAVEPLFPTPQEIGVHYLDSFTHPGDSHSFHETKAVLALPLAGPWASTVKAVNLALELNPKHIIPVHDWHWSDIAREQMYSSLQDLFASKGITFHAMQTDQPVEVTL